MLGLQEPGRLFCPHCGNATLDKVELTIAPDGTEQYGVRKRFNTRGTRFSLPKPKVRVIRNKTVTANVSGLRFRLSTQQASKCSTLWIH